MEFLESLYNIENFGIYLFVVIGGLVVLFLIILFFGKKDEKKRKEVESPVNEEKPKEVVAFQDEAVSIPLEVKEDIIKEEVIPNVNFVEETPVGDSSFNSLETEKEFDFDALAEAISKELESIDTKIESDKEPIEPVLKEEEEKLHYQVFEPVEEPILKTLDEVKVEDPKEDIKEEPEEVRVKPVMPTVFSSVYVNRDKEEKKAPSLNEEVVTPVVPKVELPKMMDLPKRK